MLNAADIDGDGDIDIVSGSSTIIQLPGMKMMELLIQVLLKLILATSADGARFFHVADIDGDGDLDIISASANDNTIAWYENDGAANPSFTAADIVTNAGDFYAQRCLLQIWMEMEI